MPLTNPWHNRPSSRQHPGGDGPNRAREREPERDHARARVNGHDDSGSPEATVVPHPALQHAPEDTDSEATAQSSQPDAESSTALVKADDARGGATGWSRTARVWAGEAQQSARAALDGSVWRARPPSLRDIHARMQRGDWAGDSRVLYVAGQVVGWPCLVLTAVFYGLLWVIRRPSHLLVAAAISVVLVLFLM